MLDFTSGGAPFIHGAKDHAKFRLKLRERFDESFGLVSGANAVLIVIRKIRFEPPEGGVLEIASCKDDFGFVVGEPSRVEVIRHAQLDEVGAKERSSVRRPVKGSTRIFRPPLSSWLL